jgi:hypothetical protein
VNYMLKSWNQKIRQRNPKRQQTVPLRMWQSSNI